jgi:polysaccharide biosynthesis protein PslA
VALQDDESIGPTNAGAVLHDGLPAFRVGRAGKRLADIAAATMGLVLFSPLLLIATVATKLDSSGPALIRENRYGYENRPIQVFKFRLASSSDGSDRGRPRLTRVGQILSQTGIDELPRLVNVLRGEMSVVGPAPSAHPKTSLNRAKPGIIEWSQIIATSDL